MKAEIYMVTLIITGMTVIGAADSASEPLRLHHIQVIGTHNSYHVRPPEYIFETLGPVREDVAAWDYTHDPLDIQLDHGVRNFELDIHPFADTFAVMHVPVVDEETTCPTFMACLATVYDWSLRNPGHIPISFLLEFKMKEAVLAGKPLREIDAPMFEILEQEILSVFPREQIITPDDIRGGAPTLKDAVRTRGWPPLEQVLGKVLFVLHNRTELRRVYTKDHPSLEGRLMFVNSSLERDDAAVVVVDNPYAEQISDLIAQNMIIRVRSDSGLRQGRSGDTARRDAAFASGAHIISTDFPHGKAHEETGYVVKFPEAAPARCNPANSPYACQESLRQIFRDKGSR